MNVQDFVCCVRLEHSSLLGGDEVNVWLLDIVETRLPMDNRET